MTAFLESSVTGLIDWCQAYCDALNQLNGKAVARVPVAIEEVYFRAAIAINRDLLGFLMGKEVSMIQNALGVVASMTRARIFEAEPTLLAYLEQAHDMLKRLDPILWREFYDVVRYVLPIRVRMMETGVDEVHELASILSKERLVLDTPNIYPLGYDQVGTVIAMLSQESSVALQAYVIKIVSPVITVPKGDGRVMPMRFMMSRAQFESRLRSLTPVELISILYGFKLYGEGEVPKRDDKRMQVESLYFLLGEGTLFPLNRRPLVDVDPMLIDMQKRSQTKVKVPQLPAVYFTGVEQIFNYAQDGSLSADNLSSSDGEDMADVRPIAVSRDQGSSGSREARAAMQQSTVSMRPAQSSRATQEYSIPPSYASRKK